MSVKGLMITPSETISRSTTVMEACRVMHREKASALAVVDAGKLCGIFTYRDLVDRVLLDKRDPETTKLEDVMTAEVDSLSTDGSYGDVLCLMVDRDYAYVSVVSEDKLAGMVSLRQLLEHEIDRLVRELDAMTRYLAVRGPGGTAFSSESVEWRAGPRRSAGERTIADPAAMSTSKR